MSKSMEAQLAGEGRGVKKKSKGIEAAFPQTVFEGKGLGKGVLYPLGQQGLKEDSGSGETVVAKIVRSPRTRKRKERCHQVF